MPHLEPLPAVLLLPEPVFLDHRAHGSIKHDNPLLEETVQVGSSAVLAPLEVRVVGHRALRLLHKRSNHDSGGDALLTR